VVVAVIWAVVVDMLAVVVDTRAVVVVMVVVAEAVMRAVAAVTAKRSVRRKKGSGEANGFVASFLWRCLRFAQAGLPI